ncbi:DNA-packaging protein gp3 [Rathayibacter sp. PhB151]|uniref:terminase small subunit n=1 Tax=Rathayibacter sp. PhB151 TaxID=2485189 RepID=UPI0010632833|nr:terminase small subunit [Rathayibacter sp. PhB151]TDX78618.1 DNA-packaging protein gp3 [Rathayibacter sp. PhB151]
MADSTTQSDKHAGGRPLKFETVDALDLAIQAYFDKQDPHVETHRVVSGRKTNGETMFEERSIMTDQKPYTISGLARALGLTRQSILNYQAREKFFDSILGAKQRCEEYAEAQLFSAYSNGAKFFLINNYKGKHQDWSDKHAIDHTSGDMPIPLPAGLATPGPLVIEDDDDGRTAQADDSADEDQQS